ncbi:hypothetical protein ABPG74_019732 [Tetrahymena malaccensis]
MYQISIQDQYNCTIQFCKWKYKLNSKYQCMQLMFFELLYELCCQYLSTYYFCLMYSLSPCPTGSGTQIPSTTPTDVSFWSICVPNYYMTVAAFNPIAGIKAYSAICISCLANSYSPLQTQTGVLSNCTCFDENALPFSATQTECTCQNGYSGNFSSVQGGSSGCTRCSSGMFSIGGTPCQYCPPGSQILNDLSSCSCYDSSTGVNPWSFILILVSVVQVIMETLQKQCQGQQILVDFCRNGYISIVGVALQESDCYFSRTTFSVVIGFQAVFFAYILILL